MSKTTADRLDALEAAILKMPRAERLLKAERFEQYADRDPDPKNARKLRNLAKAMRALDDEPGQEQANEP